MPQLAFDPLVGMTAPTSAELRDLVAANWEAAFNTGDGSPTIDTEAATPAGQLVDSETMILAQINAELLYLFSQLNPRLAEGVWQDAIGYIYFLTRKIAEPTTVQVTCTGLQGTAIPIGAQVESDDGYRYECTVATEIPPEGSALVNFQCIEAGPIECRANTINKIITVIPGWDTVSNAAPGVTGRDRESQVDFENRRFESVAKNSHGAVASLQGALWDLEGVVDCRVLENPGDVAFTGEEPEAHGIPIPGHSVAICIYGGSDEKIAETIYLKKDAGCGTYGNTTVIHQTNNTDYINAVYKYDIWRPTVVPVGIRVIINKTPLTPDGVDTKIKKAVVADFNGQDPNSGNIRVGLASTVYASRFSVAVVKTAGVQDLVEIKIQLAHNTGTALNPVWEFDNDSWDTSIVLDGKTEPTIIEDDVIVDIRE